VNKVKILILVSRKYVVPISSIEMSVFFHSEIRTRQRTRRMSGRWVVRTHRVSDRASHFRPSSMPNFNTYARGINDFT
jgi:hypothetical protein